jgi:hypothetical protein
MILVSKSLESAEIRGGRQDDDSHHADNDQREHDLTEDARHSFAAGWSIERVTGHAQSLLFFVSEDDSLNADRAAFFADSF